MKHALLVIGGAVLGGVVGYYAFFWLAKQGFYGLILPGGLLGLGAGMSKNRSIWLAVLCGLAAIGLGLFTEWSLFPFAKERSLWFFLQNIRELSLVTLLMIGVGGFIGFWVPYSRIDKHAHASMEKQIDDKDGELS